MLNDAVSNGSKILIWKQITTSRKNAVEGYGCFQWIKDTNLKANHNNLTSDFRISRAVSNGSKILIWKQITTYTLKLDTYLSCFQWIKDTNLKANHNNLTSDFRISRAVSNGSKILIWKQITTYTLKLDTYLSCFQWIKDTNLKANHNMLSLKWLNFLAVSNGSKILIWKQITTHYEKGTGSNQLFPMDQRY